MNICKFFILCFFRLLENIRQMQMIFERHPPREADNKVFKEGRVHNSLGADSIPGGLAIAVDLLHR